MADRLETAGVQLALAAVRWLPEKAALRFGRAIGRAAYRLGVRREVTRANLQRAFGPTLSAPARDALGRQAYAHVGASAIEFLSMPRLDAAAFLQRVECEGLEHLQAALAGGRGAIVASGHFGNWEMMGGGLAARGMPVTFVVQTLRNRQLDALVQRVRRGAGIQVVGRGMDLRRVPEALAANRLVHFMCDQDARRRGIFVPFFGVPASTPKGAAQFALRAGVPFIPAFGWRNASGRHHAWFTAPVIPPAADEDTAVQALLSEFNRRLEAVVRAHPEQYWWAHRRWKTRPPAADPVLAAAR